jgi:phosphatidylglycerol:prolipoprotein diacylglycerol transferase
VIFNNKYASDLTGVPLGIHLHPTQLYESALNFLNFFVLFLILRKKRFDGQVFSFYIINYSIIRYIVEFYRGDHPTKAFIFRNPSAYLSLSVPQLFCILGLIAGVTLLLILRKRKSA